MPKTRSGNSSSIAPTSSAHRASANRNTANSATRSPTAESLAADIAVYTGSFDPVTLGHLHIIERAAKLFNKLIIGIGFNAEKKSLFTPAERIELLGRVVKDLPNVEVKSFDGLAVKFVRSCGSRIMVRGVRPLTDIAGEFTMMMANRQLDEDMETVFLMADEEYAHVSSSLIKQIALLSDDKMMMRFVPKPIIKPLREKLLAQQ